MNRILLVILLFSINCSLFSQDDEPCEVEVPSSVKKLFDKGKNYKKYDY